MFIPDDGYDLGYDLASQGDFQTVAGFAAPTRPFALCISRSQIGAQSAASQCRPANEYPITEKPHIHP
jgi:hypothetical protein